MPDLTREEIASLAYGLKDDPVAIAMLLGRATEMERQVTLLRTTLIDYAKAVSGLPPLTAIRGALTTQYEHVLKILEETKPPQED